MKSIKKFLNEIKPVFLIFLLWRVGLLLVCILSFNFLTFKASFPYIDQALITSHLPQWLWHWGNFDGVHYLSIATWGYREGDQVFFPLFPSAIYLLNQVINNYFLSGFLIANSAILLAGTVFYFLIKRDFNQKTALWSTIFLFAFPTSFFFGAIYTEGLFLLLVLLAFYFKGFKSAFFGILGGLTRLIGIFVPPFFGAIGLAFYSLYLQINFSQPLYFLTAQADFKNSRASDFFHLVTPFQVVYRYLKIFLTADPTQFGFQVALIEFGAFMFGVSVLGYLSFKRLMPIKYLIFSWAALLLPTFSGTLSSMPRYLLVIFPLYIGLARIKNLKIKVGILFVSVVLLSIFTAYFVRGYWIS